MNEHAPDPQKLEEGLRRLRELGYLQGPAERYAASKVPAGASTFRVAGAMGFWVGAVGGAAVGLLLTLSALIADPRLLDRPSDLAWLGLDLVLLTSGAGLLFTLVFTASVLGWLRHSASRYVLERVLLLVPGLLTALYLTDRLARHLLPRWGGAEWWVAAAALVVLAAAIAGMATLVLTAMMATARLQWKGVWKPRPLGRAARWWPVAGAAAGSILLLALGPYASLRPLPYLDDIPVPVASAPASPLLVIALDGVDPPEGGAGMPIPVGGDLARIHPAAFWNVLSTGFSANQHGLAGAAEEGPRGLEQGLGRLEEDPLLNLVLQHVLPGVGLGAVRAADQRELRRPPFWEILAHAGVPATVVNWWATYPAARHEGLRVVSDRALLRLVAGEEIGLDAVVPQPLLERVGELEAEAWTDWPAFAQGLREIEAGSPGLRDAWTLAMVADRVHLACVEEALRPGIDSRLGVVLLNGADILTRAFRAGVPDETAEALLDLHRSWLHQALARVADDGVETWVITASSVAGSRTRHLAWEGPMAQEPRGIAPEVLRRFGVEPARDMGGDPQDEDAPSTYGRRPRWTPEVERSQGDLERLRSLGYIGG